MMGRPLIDLAGQQRGRLKVIERTDCPLHFASDSYRFATWWRCQCECGSMAIKPSKYIRSSNISSCGCQRRERRKEWAVALNAKRALTPERQGAILAMLPHHSNTAIAKKLRTAPKSVALIRREMQLPAYSGNGTAS